MSRQRGESNSSKPNLARLDDFRDPDLKFSTDLEECWLAGSVSDGRKPHGS